MKREEKEIFCPLCKTKIGKHDGRSKTDYVCRCNKCRVRVIYRVNTEKIETKPLPQRNCSSGITFL